MGAQVQRRGRQSELGRGNSSVCAMRGIWKVSAEIQRRHGKTERWARLRGSRVSHYQAQESVLYLLC